jgi:putative transposase
LEPPTNPERFRMDASMVSQMKALEEENRRLKRMYAELSMQADLLKEALGKK